MTKASITGAVIIAILQVAVAGLVTLMWGYKFCRRTHRNVVWKMIKGWFFTLKWGDFSSDWIHLGLLVLVGYCMIEAIGHSDLHRWRPTVMYNAGVIYTYLTLFAIISSVLRQCAYCWLPTEPDEHLDHHPAETLKDHHIWRSLNDISDDWRWQRVFGQLGVLILMGTYLSFVDDDSGAGMDNMASILLAAVVVACIWSAGVTAVVGFRSIIHMCAHSKRFISFRNPPTMPTHEPVELPCTCGHGTNWKCKIIHTH
jgi:hypothetical protein